MSERTEQLASNLRAIEETLAETLAKHNRGPNDAQLVGVAKYVDVDCTLELAQLGCQHIGESRPQQLFEKAAAAEQAIEVTPTWHLIGHLQRNKAKRVFQTADWIHAVDSIRLIDALANFQDASAAHQPHCLLEVNISGDQAKHGFAPSDMPSVLEHLASLGDRAPKVAGLMTMAARSGGPTVARRNFAALRELRDSLAPDCPDGIHLRELSMGMSGDWKEAIAEGATWVRIGSTLFDGIRDQ